MWNWSGGKKKRGGVTARIPPLILTDGDVAGYHTATKVNPPLRTKKDRKALREGLLNGTIDLIATDHAPHTRRKTRSLESPFSMTGLETTLGLILTEFYHTGLLSLAKLWTCSFPRPSPRDPRRDFAEGSPADLDWSL